MPSDTSAMGGLALELPDHANRHTRLESVLDTIYFLFNEGYAAHAGDALVRQDLCVEALRLGRLIASSIAGRLRRFTHWSPSWRSKPPACRPRDRRGRRSDPARRSGSSGSGTNALIALGFAALQMQIGSPAR